jgi:hypothetical protein
MGVVLRCNGTAYRRFRQGTCAIGVFEQFIVSPAVVLN